MPISNDDRVFYQGLLGGHNRYEKHVRAEVGNFLNKTGLLKEARLQGVVLSVIGRSWQDLSCPNGGKIELRRSPPNGKCVELSFRGLSDNSMYVSIVPSRAMSFDPPIRERVARYNAPDSGGRKRSTRGEMVRPSRSRSVAGNHATFR